jgi:hypothetical protein
MSATKSLSIAPAQRERASNFRHSFWTVLAASWIAHFIAVMSHEVIGHGATAYFWGVRDFRLYSTYIDFDFHGPSIGNRWIEAGGALVNLLLGAIGWLVLRRNRSSSANMRYFWLLLTAFNLLVGSCYPVYSAIVRGLDWQAVIEGLPHEGLLRILMGSVGAALYLFFIWLCASELAFFRDNWWMLTLVPYFGTMFLSCLAAYLGPLGMRMVLASALPSVAVGYVGLLLMPPVAILMKRNRESALSMTTGRVLGIVGFLVGILLCLIGGSGVRWQI